MEIHLERVDIINPMMVKIRVEENSEEEDMIELGATAAAVTLRAVLKVENKEKILL